MSSARKRMAVRRAKVESEHAKSRATLAEHHYDVIEALAKRVAEENARLRDVLLHLIERCDDSDGAAYGTLSTSFVRAVCERGLKESNTQRERENAEVCGLPQAQDRSPAIEPGEGSKPIQTGVTAGETAPHIPDGPSRLSCDATGHHDKYCRVDECEHFEHGGPRCKVQELYKAPNQ